MNRRTDDDPRISEVEYDRGPGHGLVEREGSDEAAERYERAMRGEDR